MNQLSFDDLPAATPATLHVDPVRLARRNDPATSKAAARLNHSTARMRILAAFASGAQLTFADAAELAGIEPWQASKRVSDLKQAGLIAHVLDAAGQPTVDHSDGRPGRALYQITSEGLAALRTTTRGDTR